MLFRSAPRECIRSSNRSRLVDQGDEDTVIPQRGDAPVHVLDNRSGRPASAVERTKGLQIENRGQNRNCHGVWVSGKWHAAGSPGKARVSRNVTITTPTMLDMACITRLTTSENIQIGLSRLCLAGNRSSKAYAMLYTVLRLHQKALVNLTGKVGALSGTQIA